MHRPSFLVALSAMLPHGLVRSRLFHGFCIFAACALSLGLGFQVGSDAKDDASSAHAPPLTAGSPAGHSPASASASSDYSQTAAPAVASSAASSFSSYTGGGQTASSLPSAPSSGFGSAALHQAGMAVSAAQGSGASSSSATVPAFAAMPNEPVAPKIQVPLIYQNVNPAAVGLTSSQVASINQMRSQFNAQVGQQQSTTDTQYAQSWAAAQVTMDDRLRTLLGWQQFNLYQINAAKSR